jgi:hypothetical protein
VAFDHLSAGDRLRAALALKRKGTSRTNWSIAARDQNAPLAALRDDNPIRYDRRV